MAHPKFVGISVPNANRQDFKFSIIGVQVQKGEMKAL